MTKIEMIQSRIMERMQDILSNEQLQHLENVLAIEFHGIEVQEECTQLVTSEIHWQKILRTFIASKRIENCSPGTLERYNDCFTCCYFSNVNSNTVTILCRNDMSKCCSSGRLLLLYQFQQLSIQHPVRMECRCRMPTEV